MGIQEVLQKLNVKSVYWIDDEHASLENLDVNHLAESFTTWAEVADKSMLGALKKHLVKEVGTTCRKWFKNGNWIGDAKFHSYVENCENPKSFLIDLINFSEGSMPNDELINKIEDLMAQAEEFEKYTFQRWSDRNNDILESLEEGENLLLLLDLNNAKELCFGLKDGYEVIEQLGCHEKGENVYILVLTSKYDKDKELRQGRLLTNQYCQDRSIPIFVLSKRRDMDGELPKQFEQVLDRVLLATKYTDLKASIESIYKGSIEETFKRLRSITIEELIYKIASLSRKQGVPEIDSVLRVIDRTARVNLQKALTNDSNFISLLSTCRALDAEIECSQDIDDDFISNFTLQEHYENHRAINGMHLPIQIGDVFNIKESVAEGDQGNNDKEEKNEECYYILLGNFCFTSLRESGERKDKTALLFPVLPSEPNHTAKIELRNFSSINPSVCEEGKYFIDFSNPRSQGYFDLDQCWTNSEGEAVFEFGEQAVEELMTKPLIRSQRNRIGHMMQDLKEQTSGPEQQRPKIKRIGRLTENYALRAVHFYTRLISELPEASELA